MLRLRDLAEHIAHRGDALGLIGQLAEKSGEFRIEHTAARPRRIQQARIHDFAFFGAAGHSGILPTNEH